jgi:hypothetical protein
MIFERLRRELTLATYAGRALASLTLAAACAGEVDEQAPNQGGTGGELPSSGGISQGGASGGGETQLGGSVGSGGRAQGGRVATGGDAPGGGGSVGEGGIVGCGAPGFGGDGGVGAAGGDGGRGGSGTLPTFDPKQLVCFGEDYGNVSSGYDGQCCYKALCYTPANGAACASAEDVETLGWQDFPAFPPGSGECTCYDETHPVVQGPFARHPTSPAEGEGDCCYMVGVIGCEGRPLRVEGAAVVAGVVRRADWGF